MRIANKLALGCSALAMLAPTGAFAQDVDVGAPEAQAEAAQPIVVTGSRIRRDPLDNPSPVITLDADSLAQTGLSSVADVLQRLPSSSGGLNTKVNNSGNIGSPQDGGGVGAGTSEIDLRYLLAKRTLVLVDGLRYVPATAATGIPSTIDLNSIPQGMIERIELLQSGQSPLYGSDAIAGVVNIITRSSQDGLRASAKYGQYLAEGDGKTTELGLSYGASSDRVSVVLGADYVKQGEVLTVDRELTQFPNPGQTSCTDPIGGCSSATLGGYIAFNEGSPLAPVGGGPITVRDYPLLTRGVYDPTLVGGDFRALTTADRFNFAPFNLLVTPSERYGAWLSAKIELSDAINLRTRFVYNRRNSKNQAAFLPLFIGPDAGNGNLLDTISIDVTNPYNPFGVTLSSGADGSAVNYSTVRRRLVEAGQRTYTQKVDTWTGSATLDGTFDLMGKNWYWDLNAVLGLNDAHQLFTGNVNAARIQQALGPVADCTGACVPLNIFGGAGSITPEMLAFISFDERSRSDQRLQDYTANLSGELFDLPGGAVGLAVGYEHRYQAGSFTPDPIIQAGLGADIPFQAAAGKYNTDEIYGEIRLPILGDMPFFEQLELDGSARYANYSTGFSNTSFTGTALWRPVEDLLFRGSFAEGFRAPSLGELFGAQSRRDSTIDDPCTNVAGSPFQTNATVRQNCIANGVPASGSYQEPTGGQLPTLTGGNENLGAETSKTWLFGAVYSPDWARGGALSNLSIEVNYYDITVDGAIAAINPAVTLNRCAFLGDPLACANVTRTASGIIQNISGQLQNIGEIKTSGIDATFVARTADTGAGRFGLSLNANWLQSYEETFQTEGGFATIDYRGTTRGDPDQSYPRFKGIGVLSWDSGAFDASFTGRYIASVEEADGKQLDSRFYGDIQLGFTPGFADEAFRFTLGVLNVFDTDPPPCFSCTGPNYDPTTYDIPGRYGYIQLTYKM